MTQEQGGDEIRPSPSELLKRGYSEDEISHIYELGRLFLENGEVRRAEAIFQGLTEIAPEFPAGWLGLSYVGIQNKNLDDAIFAARQALRLDPEFNEALLYLVCCLLSIGDYTTAGTYLGELGEKIEGGAITHPNMIRFYKAQLMRYQNR
ncbi:MAG: tetratricopeptide repeat protein [Deltaproteobacteria bacterium]|nr:tetratricopeptide repeat protein [Deltaproteobacteria bacterium]